MDIVKVQRRTASGLEDVGELPLSLSDIVESGENANGRYTKFADGTMICCGSALITFSAGEEYKETLATYPAAFLSVICVMSGTYLSCGYGAHSDVVHVSSGTRVCDLIVSPCRGFTFGTDVSDGVLTYTAIGRWK